MSDLEAKGKELSSAVSSQFRLSARVAAIDLDALTSMNTSAKTFYAGMNERLRHLSNAADKVQSHATDAKRFSTDIAELLQRARRLEALVDRLEEYTAKQEAALSKK